MTAPASEAERRRQLVNATLQEIGAAGTLSVSVGRIAKRAGVSPGLAFHYFGDKDTLLLAAMRAVLQRFRRAVISALRAADGHEARIEAVIATSFAPQNFEDGAVAAWLNFYVLAQTHPEAQRLLTLYHRRVASTLVADLKPMLGPERARGAADRLGALIDGLYLRFALTRNAVDPAPAVEMVKTALARELGR